MAKGSKNRTSSIKGMFRAAIKAITQRGGDDAPQPQTRRRRGETEGGGLVMVARQVMRHPGRLAARGRYALLRAGAPKFAGGGHETGLYRSDTLAMLQQWNDEALAETFDDYCPDRHTYTSLHL